MPDTRTHTNRRRPVLYVWSFFGHALAVLVAVGCIIAGVVPEEHAQWVVVAGLLIVNALLARGLVQTNRGTRMLAAIAVWALALGASFALFALLFVDAPEARHLPNLFWMYTLSHVALWEAAAWVLSRRKAYTETNAEATD